VKLSAKSTDLGQYGEGRAADFLRQHGYKIIATNWKTPRCEIDIIAKRRRKLWFVEVKYRSSSSGGYGYEYVTPKKLEQMRYAAETWVHSHDYRGEYRLAVLSVDGEDITFIDDLWS
jgi:putative endonuclease